MRQKPKLSGNRRPPPPPPRARRWSSPHLPADSDLRDVAADDDGLLGGLGPDAVWVDHSTARRLSIPLPVTAVVDQFLADGERMGGSRWDWCSLMERQRSHRTS